MRSTDEFVGPPDADAPLQEWGRHAAPGLTDGDLLDMYYTMLLSRALDERMWILNRQGKAPFVISCQGHEAAQVGSAFAIRRGEDIVLPYYRDLGVVLTLGMTPREVMLAVFARAADPNSGGKQMPSHYGHRALNIISGSSPVGTQIPQAAGVALASRLRRESAVTIAYFGEGTTSQGDFHEGINFASVHRLPVVYICENNGWAISVPHRKQMAVASVADRAAAYGIPGLTVDGADPLAVYRVARQAIDQARAGGGPSLIEARVERLTAHSSDDDDRRYRPVDERERSRLRDPIESFRRYLQEQNILHEGTEREIRQRVASAVDDASDFAERSPLPRPEDALNHVYRQ